MFIIMLRLIKLIHTCLLITTAPKTNTIITYYLDFFYTLWTILKDFPRTWYTNVHCPGSLRKHLFYIQSGLYAICINFRYASIWNNRTMHKRCISYIKMLASINFYRLFKFWMRIAHYYYTLGHLCYIFIISTNQLCYYNTSIEIFLASNWNIESFLNCQITYIIEIEMDRLYMQ